MRTVKDIVAAAIYDFAAALTVRDQSITAGKTHNAAPMADAVKDFLNKRGVEPSHDVPVKGWEQDVKFLALADGLPQPAPADVRAHIARAINHHGFDSFLGVPDFILADVALAAMRSAAQAHRAARIFESLDKKESGKESGQYDVKFAVALQSDAKSAWPFPTSADQGDHP
jgi:hypothetical protein